MLIVTLVGGPHDGERFSMSPLPGVGPPQQFRYVRVGGYDVYEIFPYVVLWPEAHEGKTVELDLTNGLRARIDSAVCVSANYVGTQPSEWDIPKEAKA